MRQRDMIMYAHGSAYNHGCEAIVRSTVDLLSLSKENTILYSNNIEGDLAFDLDDIVTVKPIKETLPERNSFLGYYYRVCSHLHKNREQMYYRYFGKQQYQYMYDFGEVAFSIGGDNYCYASALTGLEVRNYWLNKNGFKTILWGASLTEEFMSPAVIEDLNRYSLITVREKMSQKLLEKYGVKTEVVCGPDPAFALATEETVWPDGKSHKDVIGINISPFVMELAASNLSGIRNYVNLIKWILDETDCEIALIPHVVFPNQDNNDLILAQQLMEFLPRSERIFLIDGKYNCCQLKSVISKCCFFVGARTHSTIAAYSTCVPTVVVGYSSKSIGIARDIFGTDEGYVCSVQNMSNDNMLLEAFKEKFFQKDEIKKHLCNVMPNYIKGHQVCIDAVNNFLRK